MYQQDRERAKLEGQQDLIIRQLNRHLGEIDTSLIERGVLTVMLCQKIWNRI
ncbi:DUF4351 domain-containing protein [Nostoc sp.]